VAEASEGAGGLAAHTLPRVRAAALRTLGVAGDTEHLPVVQRALDDAVEEVRRAAGLALERMVRRLDLPGSWLP
jgi:HEAT repeat protein